MNNQTPSQPETKGLSADLWKAVIRFFALMIFMMAILFLAAGTIRWWEAWAYVSQGIVIMFVFLAMRQYIGMVSTSHTMNSAAPIGITDWVSWTETSGRLTKVTPRRT